MFNDVALRRHYSVVCTGSLFYVVAELGNYVKCMC